MLNLFLAILLGNFEKSSDETKTAERELLRKKSRVTSMRSHHSEREGFDDHSEIDAENSTKVEDFLTFLQLAAVERLLPRWINRHFRFQYRQFSEQQPDPCTYLPGISWFEKWPPRLLCTLILMLSRSP